MSKPPATERPAVLFFGTAGLFSRTVLEMLLALRQPVRGVVMPGDPAAGWHTLPAPAPVGDLPLLTSFVAEGPAELAWREGLPVWQVGRWGEAALDALRELAPAAIVVACWPRRLPGSLLALPPWGVLNVHPSLLPDFRGPAPLFWQLREGKRSGGVTIHRMSERLDEGPILAQHPFAFPPGATGEGLDRIAARHGGQLLARVLDELARGRSRPTPQPEGGSYQPWPDGADFTVPTRWPARRAWNFMRAAEEWGIPFTVQTPGHTLRVRRALDLAPTAALTAPYALGSDSIAVQFTPGVLRLSLPIENGE